MTDTEHSTTFSSNEEAEVELEQNFASCLSAILFQLKLTKLKLEVLKSDFI